MMMMKMIVMMIVMMVYDDYPLYIIYDVMLADIHILL